MKNSGFIAFVATLLMGVMAHAEGLTINCQDTLSDSNIQLHLNDTAQIDHTTVKLIANGGAFRAKAVTVAQNQSEISEIVVTSGEGTVDFNYQFKNLDVEGCFGSKAPNKENPTHVEVVAWKTVLSWLQCGCIANGPLAPTANE